MAYDYSRADWDGLRDHLRDVLWEDIFKACVRYFYQIFIFSPNDSPSKIMKNVCYLI